MKNTPYDNDSYAEMYDKRYLHAPSTKQIINYELEILEEFMVNKSSWMDVACGTGYELRNASGNISRYGLDQSSKMIDVALKRNGHKVDFTIDNLLSHVVERNYDLVTNFWYGYIHQSSLEEVEIFFKKMVEMTKDGGDIFVAICNPWGIFSNYEYKWDSIYNNNDMTLDAIVWSSKIKDTTHEYKHCHAPHPQLICNWISPHFEETIRVDYPTEPKRFGFLFKQKR
tara:strand:- start:927 stop:1607 length:681 start_codon:yes stop_codon:yes gene_type:complete